MVKRWMAMVCLLVSSTGFAFENLANDDLPTMDYSVDVRLGFHEPLFKAGSDVFSTNTLYPEGKGAAYRSLGLRSSEFQLGIENFHQSLLSLALRPEVFGKESLPGEGAPRDFDSRTGSVYRKKPFIFLLNQYQVGILYGDQMKLSFGVWEKFIVSQFPFSDINEFGLLVQLPNNFSGFRTDLRRPLNSKSQVDVSMLVLRGRGERVDHLASNSQSLDVSTSSLNPYWGGAILLHWLIEANFDGSFLAGFEERREFEGKVQEAYAGIFLIKQFRLWDRRLALGLDSRAAFERWFRNLVARPALLQASSSLFGRVELFQSIDFILGLQIGKSDRFNAKTQEEAVFTGKEIDIGFLVNLKKNLSFSAILSDEERFVTDNGRKSGRFIQGDDKDRIVRVGFDLRYRF